MTARKRNVEDLKAISARLPAYVPHPEKRRLMRARIRAMEQARGLPTTVPWDDAVDGSPFEHLEVGS